MCVCACRTGRLSLTWDKIKPKWEWEAKREQLLRSLPPLSVTFIFLLILGIYIAVIDQLASHNVLVHWPYHLTTLWCHCYHRETAKETFIILNYLGPELRNIKRLSLGNQQHTRWLNLQGVFLFAQFSQQLREHRGITGPQRQKGLPERSLCQSGSLTVGNRADCGMVR